MKSRFENSQLLKTLSELPHVPNILLISSIYDIAVRYEEIMENYKALSDTEEKEKLLNEKIQIFDVAFTKVLKELFRYLLKKYEDRFGKLYDQHFRNSIILDVDLEKLYDRDFQSGLDEEDAYSFKVIKNENIMTHIPKREILEDLRSAVSMYNQYRKGKSFERFTDFKYRINAITEFCRLLNNPKEEVVYLEYVLDNYLNHYKKSASLKAYKITVQRKNEFIRKIKNEILLCKARSGYDQGNSSVSRGHEYISNEERTLITTESSKTKKSYVQTKAKNRIQWKLSKTDLIGFFQVLHEAKFITELTDEYVAATIRDCFVDEKGIDFDNQKMSKLKKQKGTKDSNAQPRIRQAVEKFNKTITPK